MQCNALRVQEPLSPSTSPNVIGSSGSLPDDSAKDTRIQELRRQLVELRQQEHAAQDTAAQQLERIAALEAALAAAEERAGAAEAQVRAHACLLHAC
jgi:uncharacterized protein involved in exopolysaccharide biosynthesis